MKTKLLVLYLKDDKFNFACATEKLCAGLQTNGPWSAF